MNLPNINYNFNNIDRLQKIYNNKFTVSMDRKDDENKSFG